MMRALLWKEYREHRSIWLAMASTAFVLLYTLNYFMAPAQSVDAFVRDILPVAAVVLAWTYGMVCGAMLLAGERENGTLGFLDELPLRRLQLWWGKCLIGGLLVGAQALFLIGLTIYFQVQVRPVDLAYMLCMLGFGVAGLGWGLLYSANGHNVLQVVGLAIATQVLASILLSVVVTAILQLAQAAFHLGGEAAFVAALLSVLAMATVPLLLSARLFSGPDRLRLPDRYTATAAAAAPVRARGGYPRAAVMWLTWQQMKRMTVGLLAASLVLSLVLLAPSPALWPMTTLFFGVLCGVTVFADEQMSGSRRFLGDQRFPLTRLWLIKVLMRLGLCLAAAVVLFLPSAIRGMAQPGEHFERPGLHLFFAHAFQLRLLGVLIPTPQYLLLGLMYGFSLGHLCGLLFQRSIVAAVLALGSSSLLLSLWLPSLICGGLHFWQPALVPVIVIVTARLLLAPWAADRLLSRQPLLCLSGCIVLALGAAAVALDYRVAEVPDVAEPAAVEEVIRNVPTPDENQGGLRLRSACAGILSRESDLPERLEDMHKEMDHVVHRGWTRRWPAGMPELGHWLDALFEGEWAQQVAEAAELPIGTFEDPRLLTLKSRFSFREAGVHVLAHALVCQGLHEQARGKPAAFLKYLRQGLVLARTLENKAPLLLIHQAWSVERTLLLGVQRWLEGLSGHPELLRQALQILTDHEAAVPGTPAAARAVEYLILRTTLEQTPEVLLGDGPEAPSEEESKAYVLSLLFPWEHERQTRILRRLFQDDLPAAEHAYTVRAAHDKLHSLLARAVRPGDSWRVDFRAQTCRQRAVRQLVALRLYQAETGRAAPSLDVLVGKYLPSLPDDPFGASGHQPFLYRLSEGERVEMDDSRTAIDVMLEPQQGGGAMPGVAGQGGAPGGDGNGPGGKPPGGMVRVPPAGGMPGPEIAPPGAVMWPDPLQPGHFVPAGQGMLWSAGRNAIDGNSRFRRMELIWLVPLPRK